MKQRVRNPAFPQYVRGCVQRISFSDGTKIQHYSRPAEPDGGMFRVEIDQVHSHVFTCLGNLFIARAGAARAHKPPSSNQWGNGDIEGSSGDLEECLAR